MSNEDYEAQLESEIKDLVYIHLTEAMDALTTHTGESVRAPRGEALIAIEQSLQKCFQSAIWALGDRLESYLNRRLDERLANVSSGKAVEEPAPKSEPAKPAKAKKPTKRLTKKAVREKLREYISSSDKAIAAANRKHVKQVLVDMGAQHLDDLKPSQYQELLDKLYA